MPEATPPPSPAPAAPAAPAKSGNRVLIIILCVILGFFLLIGGCVATCTYLAAKKMKEVGRAAKEHPVFTSLSLAASLNPEVQVISKDADTGIIKVRNKRTGETVTINANDFTQDNINEALEKMNEGAKAASAAAAGAAKAVGVEPLPTAPASTANEPEKASASAGEPAISPAKAAAMAAILGKFPDFVPAYPGATTLEASQNGMGAVRAKNYVFVTKDKIDAVVDFYAKKATAAGFTQLNRSGDTNDYGPTAAVNFMRASPQGTIIFNAESKPGGALEVSIVESEVGQ